jgi:hypothetical protein
MHPIPFKRLSVACWHTNTHVKHDKPQPRGRLSYADAATMPRMICASIWQAFRQISKASSPVPRRTDRNAMRGIGNAMA